MSDIALYNLLKRIPAATDGEIEKAVSELAKTKDVATKADVERMGRVIVMWVVAVGLAVVGLVKYL